MKVERNQRIVARRGSAGAVALAAVTVAALTAASTTAQAQELGVPEPVRENTGPGVSARPGAYFPSVGDMGFNVDANATYGIGAEPFVIAPGGRFASYFGDQGAISGMPVVEAMLPVGPVVPYAKAGAGIGHTNGPEGETGLSLMAGGGFDFHVSRDVLVGVDATWETVTGTDFNALSIGPRAGIRY